MFNRGKAISEEKFNNGINQLANPPIKIGIIKKKIIKKACEVTILLKIEELIKVLK